MNILKSLIKASKSTKNSIFLWTFSWKMNYCTLNIQYHVKREKYVVEAKNYYLFTKIYVHIPHLNIFKEIILRLT